MKVIYYNLTDPEEWTDYSVTTENPVLLPPGEHCARVSYYVTASNEGGESGHSNQVTLVCADAPHVPPYILRDSTVKK